jgi:hypothetical protein
VGYNTPRDKIYLFSHLKPSVSYQYKEAGLSDRQLIDRRPFLALSKAMGISSASGKSQTRFTKSPSQFQTSTVFGKRPFGTMNE